MAKLWKRIDEAPLEIKEVLQLATSLARALACLHSSGELWDHSEEGVDILEDGSMNISGTLSEVRKRVSPGTVDASIDFVTPEGAASSAHDNRSDIFGWGFVVYSALTGKTPFSRPSVIESMNAMLSGIFPAPSSLRSECPPQLDALIAQCLAKDPANRIQSADKLVNALLEMS